MNEVVSADNPDPESGKSSKELESLKTITTVVYALQALSCLWGVTAIVGVIMNYVKREDAVGTLYQSHFDWQIRTFWWGLLWSVIGVVTLFIVIGIFVLLAAWIWMVYRVVKGWMQLNENKPMAALERRP